MDWNKENTLDLCKKMRSWSLSLSEAAASVTNSSSAIPDLSALGQMKQVQKEFKKFQKSCKDLPIYPYLKSAFQEFAEQAADLSSLIKGDLEQYKKTTNAVFKIEALEDIRDQIIKISEDTEKKWKTT